VFSKREGKKIRKSFRSLDEAKVWRQEAQRAVRRGTMRQPSRQTLREAAEAFLQGARAGAIANRSGDPYKPSAIRGYEKALKLRVLPVLGDARFSEITRIHVQDLVDDLRAKGLAASTIDSTLNPLRAIYRRAVARGELAINPTRELETPAIRSKPKRIASPAEAAALITALPAAHRALWATAFYAGLRRGELRGLRWGDVDLAGGLIHVERSWDDLEGEIAPKSAQGRRRVPIPGDLRDYLDEHKLTAPHAADNLVFGEGADQSFSPRVVTKVADDAWADAELERFTLHQCRHTFASLMIAAGVNAKALSTFMGHANISITLDLYGHLMPGSEEEAASLLDAYLEAERTRAEERARHSEGAIA
jgi:integrase